MKGLKVTITITQKKSNDEDEDSGAAKEKSVDDDISGDTISNDNDLDNKRDESSTPADAVTTTTTTTTTKDVTQNMVVLDLGDSVVDHDNQMYDMRVASDGKFTRKANWDDLKRFTGQEVNSDVLRDWIVNYQKRCFPSDLEKPNSTPKHCYIKDEKGVRLFKDFGWKAIKLNLKPGVIDIKDRWSKEMYLETFPLDYSTNMKETILKSDKCDKEIVSTLRKSKLRGHPLALEMMTTDSEIVTEFVGLNSVTTSGVFGNNKEPTDVDDETGDDIWNDVKTLRGLLEHLDFPKRPTGGNSREAKVDVVCNESYLKARVYYKAFFSNDVVTDHGDKFDGKPYWCFPLKYLFQYNDKPNAIVVYEDIELKFFTDVHLAMENKDWDWVKDEHGRWKKQYNK